MKENKVGFSAGLAGGFGFYVAWMIVAMNWQTATIADERIKNILGLILGLVVGVLLYQGAHSLMKNKPNATNSKRITRYTTLGIVAGLVVAFLFGMLFYNPAGVGFTPLFPLKPLFPLE